MKKFTKKCIDRLLSDVAELEVHTNLMNALISYGYQVFDSRFDRENLDKYVEGISKARSALYHKFCVTVTEMYMFQDDPKIREHGLQKLAQRFNTTKKGLEANANISHEIMSLLEQYGRVPSSYFTKDQEEFVAEIEEKLENK
jgi:hypothetical protein